MSQAPAGRATARWSVAWQLAGSPALIAGLPAASAWVFVGPPLFASAPSSGFTPGLSPTAENPQVPSSSMLWLPCQAAMVAALPAQSPPPLPATIVSLIVAAVGFCPGGDW